MKVRPWFFALAGTAALGAAAGGIDLRVIGTFTSRIPFDLVVRPNVESPKDLKGKCIGVQVIGGKIWMAAMLGLEHRGMDSGRDIFQIVAAGDQTILSQALEFPILVVLSRTNIPLSATAS